MYSTVKAYYDRLSAIDFLRKILSACLYYLSKLNILRSIKGLYYFKTVSIRLGKNVRVHGLSYNIKVGAKTYFYDNCIFEFSNTSQVEIGSNTVFSYGVIFCCREKIVIGNDVQVGEYTSIRDSTHRHDELDKPMKYSADELKPIIIGNDVWIGRGCIVLPGVVIEDGVVVAANSIVKGKLEKNSIYGGTPAKFIKSRNPDDDLHNKAVRFHK
jgi:acetyltransferase-like isoleucine patch superfamily enzyme